MQLGLIALTFAVATAAEPSEPWMKAPSFEENSRHSEEVQEAARYIREYYEHVAEREAKCYANNLNEVERRRMGKIATEVCATFADPLLRPIFPLDRPALGYLKGDGLKPGFGATPYWREIKRMDRFAATEDFLGSRRSRITIGRIITNDLWPLVSPCRTRLNIRRQLSYKRSLMECCSPNGVDLWLSEIARRKPIPVEYSGVDSYVKSFERIENTTASLPADYRVSDFWMLYHILNGTEHNLALTALQPEYFLFPQPLNLPLLSRATNYIAYLQNEALAKQVMWRESSSLWTRWSLPITPNHFIPQAVWETLERNVRLADRTGAEFILIPTYKLISSVPSLESLDKGTPLTLSSSYKFRRTAPQILIKFNATMDRFAAELNVNGGASWSAAVYATVTKALAAASSGVAPPLLCPDALFPSTTLRAISTDKTLYELLGGRRHVESWILHKLHISPSTFEKEQAVYLNGGADAEAFEKWPPIEPGASAESDGMLHQLGEKSLQIEKRLMSTCGYIVELESFPPVPTDAAEKTSKNVGEWCSWTYNNVREPIYGDSGANEGEYIRLAAEVLQRTVEHVLTR